MTNDPTRESGPPWNELLRLVNRMDADIEALYVRRGVQGMRSRFVRPLIRLRHEGPMTIGELAGSLASTHSATSQTVTAMRSAGFVSTAAGVDGRTQVVSLTAAGAEIVPLLEAEWRATDAVTAALDDELGGVVTQLAERLAEALARRSMGQRLDDELGG